MLAFTMTGCWLNRLTHFFEHKNAALQGDFVSFSVKGDSKVIELNQEGGCNSAPNGLIVLKYCMEGTFVHLF